MQQLRSCTADLGGLAAVPQQHHSQPLNRDRHPLLHPARAGGVHHCGHVQLEASFLNSDQHFVKFTYKTDIAAGLAHSSKCMVQPRHLSERCSNVSQAQPAIVSQARSAGGRLIVPASNMWVTAVSSPAQGQLLGRELLNAAMVQP